MAFSSIATMKKRMTKRTTKCLSYWRLLLLICSASVQCSVFSVHFILSTSVWFPFSILAIVLHFNQPQTWFEQQSTHLPLNCCFNITTSTAHPLWPLSVFTCHWIIVIIELAAPTPTRHISAVDDKTQSLRMSARWHQCRRQCGHHPSTMLFRCSSSSVGLLLLACTLVLLLQLPTSIYADSGMFHSRLSISWLMSTVS